eukprot:TRINITY_DN5767_c0_g1_i1.p1 TRINITY_DN5767_c0_g1~~TRINITY_DN5767_c0_g1_i1.p1  ORF type:complete len:102 (-),score=9.28 TRINITY_DN5767_c0_g1_i1:28-333(-)
MHVVLLPFCGHHCRHPRIPRFAPTPLSINAVRQLEMHDTLSYMRIFNKGLTATQAQELAALDIAHDDVVSSMKANIIYEQRYPGDTTAWSRTIHYDEPKCF